MEFLLKSDKPILAFPEIETVSNGNGGSIKTGRTYSGKTRKFAPALFSPAIHVAKEGKKVYVVPVAVSYDFIAEENYFGKLVQAEKLKKSANFLIGIVGMLYYTFLESHFFRSMFNLGKGNIYIDMGQPILVEPNNSKKELAQGAQAEATKCYRVTMPALVSYGIAKGIITLDELQKSIKRYASILKEVNVNFNPSEDLEEDVNLALQDLAYRNILSIQNSICVKKPEIINYYANTIAHHLDHL